MRILFDEGTPAPLHAFLTDHTVRSTKSQGWAMFTNGDLLAAAEGAGFEVLVTTDKNIRYQQNLTGRTFAIVVLGTSQWPDSAVARRARRDRGTGRRARQLHRSRDTHALILVPVAR